jgi:four helix bundle protein
MSFKFEQLDVWNMLLDYSDSIYELADKLPESERFNLKLQIIRAATSISLNIAEGSTGQSDPEQSRFLGMAIRSLIETVACQRLITRREARLAGTGTR